ncbi:MFS transporter, partial [Streptomyces cellulosae]
ALVGVVHPLRQERTARRRERQRAGLRRYRPGAGQGNRMYSPGMAGTAGAASRTSAMAEQRLDDEIEQITHALQESGPTSRDELKKAVGGHSWGPRRFRRALRESKRESRVKDVGQDTYAPADGHGGSGSAPGAPGRR